MQPSEEIKQKLDIVDVIREYIPLKPAGVNFHASCPFHREKTPSFVVSPEKQIWHCFGCGKGGDIFSFVMEHEGLNFAEVLRLLAPKAGVTLKRHDPKMTSQRNRLLDIVDLSRKFYHEILIKSPNAEGVRQYLNNRGLTQETIDEWQIGYAPDSWDDLLNFLKGKRFVEPEIFLAGMIVKKDGVNRFYNRFRGRVMFPINNINSNPVGFSARVSPRKEATEQMGKYINSPQSLIYDKSKILFGLDKAKRAIKEADSVIIVEGQMDVITAHQHGFKNVIAQSGTALTQDQVKIIKRYTNNLYFALDSDSAGQMSIERGDRVAQDFDYQEVKEKDKFGRTKKYIDPLLSHNINIKVIEIPEGKDPDDAIRNNPDEWKRSIETAKPIMQYHFEYCFSALDLENIEDKRKAVKKLLPKIAKLGDRVEKDYWIKKLSEAIDIREVSLRETLRLNQENNYSKRLRTSEKQKNNNDMDKAIFQKPKNRGELLSELFLAMFIKFPDFLKNAIDSVHIENISGDDSREFYKNAIIYYNEVINSASSTQGFSYDGFRNWVESGAEIPQNNGQLKILRLLDKLVLLGDENFYEFTPEQANIEFINIKKSLKQNYINARKKEIEKLITRAEKEDQLEEINKLMNELKILSEENLED